MNITINGKKVNVRSIKMSDVDMRDYPDFCDAYVEYAEFEDGAPLNEDEMEIVTEEHGCELAHQTLF